MHPIKKIYCRIFQFGFKVAIPFLPYRKPKIVKSLDRLPRVLAHHHCQSVLIITDQGVRNLGLLQPMLEAFEQAELSYMIYDKTVANPTTDNVEEALQIYHQSQSDAIIGFGGGSSIDCAKAVGARVAKPNQSLGQMKGVLRVLKRLPLLIAVPTTAGTGSETTLASVIVDSKTRHKYAINDFPLIPRYAVLDPKVTVSLPPFLTATTGMDALTHAVEAYIGGSTTKDTRRDALRAVRLIFKYLPQAVKQGNNLRVRRQMLNASYFAGCAFTKSYVGYVHAVAHSLGGKYNVPHGLANAVLLPHVLEVYGKSIHKKLKHLAIVAGLADKFTDESVAARLFIDAIIEMKKSFGISDTVPELKEADIKELAIHADHEANPLYPVPVLMNADELQVFYYMILERENRGECDDSK